MKRNKLRSRASLPFDSWPEEDQTAWQNAVKTGDIFDVLGAAARWADTTKSAVKYDYGRWLMFLTRHEPEALVQPLTNRITKDHLEAYLEHLGKTVASVGIHSYLRHLQDALRVMAPESAQDELKKLVKKCERNVISRSKSNRIVNSSRLEQLGTDLMEGALSQPDPDYIHLLAYRDGLIIALLARRPLRRRTLASIQIDEHLIKENNDWKLVFEGKEIKSGRYTEINIPECLNKYMDCYLTQIRPRFPHAEKHKGLWAGMKGCPLTGEAIYQAVIKRTREAFGHGVNPHLFRDCAATTIATTKPEQVQIARDLLGHASLTTTAKYYIQAKTIHASRIHAEVLANARKNHSCGHKEER